MRIVLPVVIVLALLVVARPARAQAAPATMPAGGKLPHVQVDVDKREVRVECETLGVDAMLEFFCVLAGTSEHEAVVRTRAKPSHVHMGLLMLGLEPGQPVRYSEAAQRWLPPEGPPLRVSMEYDDPKNPGRTVRVPAYRWMRNTRTKQEMPAMTWIFSGSRVMEDGRYAADVTGYVVSVVNFDLTMIDIPNLASNANETLEWERNADLVPPAGTTVTMVIEPAGAKQAPPATAPAASQPAAAAAPAKIDIPQVTVDHRGRVTLDGVEVGLHELTRRLADMKGDRPLRARLAVAVDGLAFGREVETAIREAGVEVDAGAASPEAGPLTKPIAAVAGLTDVQADDAMIAKLRARWDAAVRPHGDELREAAQTHYEVLASLRREQQRIIDEADKIQRLIDELERDYQDLTTPQPEPVGR